MQHQCFAENYENNVLRSALLHMTCKEHVFVSCKAGVQKYSHHSRTTWSTSCALPLGWTLARENGNSGGHMCNFGRWLAPCRTELYRVYLFFDERDLSEFRKEKRTAPFFRKAPLIFPSLHEQRHSCTVEEKSATRLVMNIPRPLELPKLLAVRRPLP